MSKLRRDRKALAWARYTKRNNQLIGLDDMRETWGTWHAMAWMLRRKVHSTWDGERRSRQMLITASMFYNL